ncbi:MAG TPA: dihydropteroate synthase [Capsulimonadaceae bacterium]|nr:dihydropteroate synthase [Capsulimonadaceae bacterium]
MDDSPQLDSGLCAYLVGECGRHLGLLIGELNDFERLQTRGSKKTDKVKELAGLKNKALKLIDRLIPVYRNFADFDDAGPDSASSINRGSSGHVRVIGERLTAGNESVKSAISFFLESEIAELARWQAQSGAHHLDVSAGALGTGSELVGLAWLARIAEDTSRRLLSLDCQNPEALRHAISICRWPPIWNSLCPAAGNVSEILAMLKEELPCAGVVAVLQNKWGEFLSADERIALARKMADSLTAAGVEPERWIFDPVTLPQSTGPEWAGVTLETISRLKERFPESSVLCAVSNYSYGLAKRRAANRSWAQQALDAGADIFLCDPLDGKLMQSLPRLHQWP